MAVIDTDNQQRAPFSSTEQAAVEQNTPLPFSFTEWQKKCVRLKSDWISEVQETVRRRLQRKVEVDVPALRKQGLLKDDETLIARRVIDENIMREQPNYVAYLKQSHRLAVFKCLSYCDVSTENLEQEFTTLMNYPGMDSQLLKTRDGTALHGWDSVEVTFDITKPGHCAVEHIGHDNLMFPRKSLGIQSCPFIMRRFEITLVTLQDFASGLGFDPAQVKKISDEFNKTEERMLDNIPIFKVFFKQDGIVYVGWIELENKTDNWLRAPIPLTLGRRRQELVPDADPMTGMLTQRAVWEDVVEKFYPVVLFPYTDSEEDCIACTKGRAFYDLPSQEAQTALVSLYVNGNVRASNVYASATGNGDGLKLQQLDVSLEHGCVYSQELKFWAPPYPDPALLRGINFLDVKNQQETGNVAAAVVNRQDARKTKAEIDAATSEDDALEAVPMANFSNSMQETLMMCWLVVQSQGEQGLIQLLQVPVPTPLGEEMLNDYKLIGYKYSVKAAGDVDVIKRKEKLQRRFNIWPFIVGTPVQTEFIKDLIREMLPDDARKYIELLDQAQMNKDQMLMAMAGMLQSAVTDEKGTLKPEFASFAPQLEQMKAMLQQVMSMPQPGTPDANGQQSGGANPNNQQTMLANNVMSQQINKTVGGQG